MMCRWVVYMGKPIFLSEVITKPKHSIVSMATIHFLPNLFVSTQLNFKSLLQESKANHLINGDGFGIGWYMFEFSPEPCVFSSVTPPWNNINLSRICDHIKSPLFFGHVRAATAGSVTEINCHPFQIGRHMFMHNGGIPDFYKYKASFLTSMCDSMIRCIKGTTDTEHIFAYLMNNVPDASEHQSLEVLLWALLHTIRFVIDITGRICSLNLALTDGVYTIATRFRNGFTEKPPALYYTAGRQFNCVNGNFVCEAKGEEVIDAVVIASEPLTYDADQWKKVPCNSMLITGPAAEGKGRKFLTAKIHIGGVVDRCFKKWKSIALTGKNIKTYCTSRNACKSHDKPFLDQLSFAFDWAKDSQIAC